MTAPTKAELNEMFALAVMGWEKQEPPRSRDGMGAHWEGARYFYYDPRDPNPRGRPVGTFRPTERLEDAFAGLLNSSTHWFQWNVSRSVDGRHYASVTTDSHGRKWFHANDRELCMALVICQLRAVGAMEER